MFIFAPLLIDIPRWQKVMMMTSGRIFKKISSVFVLHFDAASNRLGFFSLLLSDFLNVPSNSFPKQLKTRSGCTSAFFPRVTFQMSSQITLLNK